MEKWHTKKVTHIYQQADPLTEKPIQYDRALGLLYAEKRGVIYEMRNSQRGTRKGIMTGM